MNIIKLFTFLCFFVALTSCGGDDKVDVTELPDRYWDVKLNGSDFDIKFGVFAQYDDFFNGDLHVSGSKYNSADERIVLTFSVEEVATFADGQSLDLSQGSGNSVLYFDNNSNQFSSLFLDGSGTFTIDQFIQTDSGDFISGTVNGVLFNETDSTSVNVAGSLAALTIN